MKTHATICIPTTRSSSTLQECIASLDLQTCRDFDILLITREPTQLNITTGLKYQQIHQHRPGLVGAMNDALEHIKNPVTIRIDDDVTLEPQWFEGILESFKDPRVGGVTGPTIIPSDELHSRDLTRWLTALENTDNLFMKFFRWLYVDYLYENRLKDVGRFLKSGVFTLGSNFQESRLLPGEKTVDHVEACNMAFRTNLLKELGGFDPAFTKGLGDYHEADISFKVVKKGYKIVFNPKTTLYHHIGQGTAESRGEAYDRMRNFIRFYKRHLRPHSLDAWCRFGVNLLLQNGYFIYKFMTTGKPDNLGAPIGSIVELITHE